MKKLAALLLAGVMCVGMSTSVFAADTGYTATEAKSAVQNITKSYTSDESFIPTEDLEFNVTADSSNPDSTKLITVGNNNTLSVGGNTMSYNLPINLPSYDTHGVYKYTVTEKDKGTAGVTYATETIHVIVMVEFDNTTKKLKIGNVNSYIEKIDNTKTDTFSNKYNTGDVSVSKAVTGNMASLNDSFTVNYTLSSEKPVNAPVNVNSSEIAASSFTKGDGTNAYTYTGTITVSAGDSAAKAFANLPTGMTVSISEDNSDDNMKGYTLKSYKVDDGNGTTNAPTITVSDGSNNAVVITNEKGEEISTGINMDSVPYIVICGIVVLGAAVIITKKRFTED